MKNQIITQELGDGYFHHHLNISTYYYYQSIVSPVSLKDSTAKVNNRPVNKTNLGQYQPYRLSQFVSNVDSYNQRGEIVKLASVDKGQLVINPQATAIFNKYPNNQIAFVGNYGRRNSGKSFWYDKILNLSDVDGNNYSANRRQPGLYFWSIPYSKDNLKFFLVDYAGFEGKDKLTPQQQKLLDLQLFICQKMVIVPEPEDEELTVLSPAYNHLLQSQRRFSDKGIQANKFSPYWPNQIYTLYRSSRPVKKQIDNIGVLFSVYNFSILHDALDPSKSTNKQDLLKSNISNHPEPLNQKYVKMTSFVFKDIYDKMKGKQFGNIKLNGKNLPYILQQSNKSINSGKGVKIDQIFDGVQGNIYDNTIQKCKRIYLNEVAPIRQSKDPKPLDVLTDAFDRGSIKAFKQFDKEVIDPRIHQQNQIKLQSEINNIENDILKENNQKTYDYYNKKLPNNDSTNPNDYFDKLKQTFTNQKQSTKLDQNDFVPVQKRLQSSTAGESQIFLLPLSDQQKINKFKKIIDQKKKQLQRIRLQKNSALKGGKNDPEANKIVDKHSILISKVSDLRKQLQQKKTAGKPEDLLQNLRFTHKKNEQTLNDLKNKTHKQQEISTLKDLLKRIIQQNSLIQSRISGGPNLDKTNLSNRSAKSVIRDVKGQNIKKVNQK